MSSIHAPRSANSVDEHVGKQIRERRLALKLSQEKLGLALGVTFQQVQKYERGTNRVGAGRLWKLSQVLEVPVSYFYEGILGGIKFEVAEDEQPPFMYDFLNSEDGLALAEAVSRIKNPAVRAKLIELARSLADE